MAERLSRIAADGQGECDQPIPAPAWGSGIARLDRRVASRPRPSASLRARSLSERGEMEVCRSVIACLGARLILRPAPGLKLGRTIVGPDEHLAAALLPPGSGASFTASRHSGLARVEPLTVAAEAWLRGYAGPEASWDDDALVLEMRYFPQFAEAAITAGHTFERDLRPS